jgi:hypothetical protein
LNQSCWHTTQLIPSYKTKRSKQKDQTYVNDTPILIKGLAVATAEGDLVLRRAKRAWRARVDAAPLLSSFGRCPAEKKRIDSCVHVDWLEIVQCQESSENLLTFT